MFVGLVPSYGRRARFARCRRFVPARRPAARVEMQKNREGGGGGTTRSPKARGIMARYLLPKLLLVNIVKSLRLNVMSLLLEIYIYFFVRGST